MISENNSYWNADWAKASKITDNIYQGNFSAASNKKHLEEIGITHVLVAGKYLEKFFPDKFKYLDFQVDDIDFENLFKYFQTAYEFIDDCITNNGIILIHCAAGISRSTTFTCCYLIKKLQIEFDKALEMVKKARPIAGPNYGFQKQLKLWYLQEVEKKDVSKEVKELDSDNYSNSKDSDSYNYINSIFK
jgi:dual specificity phosphatase 12